MSKLIGIGGRLASGKDTVADFLVEKHGWIKLNMSAPLHEAALALNPWIQLTRNENGVLWRESDVYLSREFYRYAELTDLLGYTKAKEIRDYREFLQRLGTQVGREMFGENTWTNIATRNIDRLRSHGDNVVITGIRFPNEFSMIRDNHGLDGSLGAGQLVWVDRPGQVENPELVQHDSERLTSEGFDLTIENSGTLEDLYQKVDNEIA